jgi:hypothetical protein
MSTLTTQIASVRHVSVSERAVADTCLVTESPKKLKSEMEHATSSPDQSTAGVCASCAQPRGRSSQAAAGDEAGTEISGSRGNIMTIESAPKRPS